MYSLMDLYKNIGSLVGKKVSAIIYGEKSIEIFFEDGFVLEICAWAWSVDCGLSVNFSRIDVGFDGITV